MTALFSLDNHQLSYGAKPVLSNVTIDITAGEKVALVGPSGAGKTSLLNVLYQQAPELVALCPQDYGLVEILSVYHNIYMGQLERHHALYNLWNLAFPVASHVQRVSAIARQLGLENELKHSADRLSGGQRQRVAIGRALYRERPVFMGDEPVSSLDALQGQMILEQLVEAHETVVVALHNRRLALTVFDRIVGIQGGRIAFDRPASEVDPSFLDQLYAQ